VLPLYIALTMETPVYLVTGYIVPHLRYRTVPQRVYKHQVVHSRVLT